MSHKEIPRAGLLKAALAGKITNQEGAKALQLTLRHFQRLKDRFHREGAGGLPHRSRGRPSGRGLPAGVRKKVSGLMKTTYAGFNDCHLTEKLREVEKISIGRETVRQIRIENGLSAQRRRRSPKHRSRRLREARRGALVQVDGSLHDWLEGRGPKMCLHGAVDDATGELLGLHFELTEDLHGYAMLFRKVFMKHGLPAAIYGDRTGILVRNDNYWTIEEELRGYRGPTHMGQMLDDLGIGYIEAHSPQAKGRIENRWETLQDRLVQELRLLGISTMEAANAVPAHIRTRFQQAFRPATTRIRLSVETHSKGPGHHPELPLSQDGRQGQHRHSRTESGSGSGPAVAGPTLDPDPRRVPASAPTPAARSNFVSFSMAV